MLARYYVTGWSGRFSHWIAEAIEAKSKAVARERFVAKYPTLKRVKTYPIGGLKDLT